MSPLRMIYLGLACIGLVWSIRHYVAWIVAWNHEHGASLSALIGAWRANDATIALALDMLVVSITLTIWIIAEVWVRRNWRALWAIPATLLIGPGFGLPLYLFLRTRPVI